VAGQSVLILGAGGNVGAYTVQFGHQHRARCRGNRRTEGCRVGSEAWGENSA
jgi:NADPH:quinone reductase-like Zn-dependent oxidoreductase